MANPRSSTEAVRDVTVENLVPTHVAIIMDGNGRWAVQNGSPRTVGHKAGVDSLRRIVATCLDLGIRYLSVYVFSTENWKRPRGEVAFLMKMIPLMVARESKTFMVNNVRLRALGDLNKLDPMVRTQLDKIAKQTEHNTKLDFNLMINYGSRAELVHACRQAMAAATSGNLRPEALTESTFESFLWTSEIPDPDLLIRTGGEFRLSNFLLWQLAYSEIFITQTLWPDFSRNEFIEIIEQFNRRSRRFGGL